MDVAIVVELATESMLADNPTIFVLAVPEVVRVKPPDLISSTKLFESTTMAWLAVSVPGVLFPAIARTTLFEPKKGSRRLLHRPVLHWLTKLVVLCLHYILIA